MQRLEVSGAVRPLKWPLGVKWLTYLVEVPTLGGHISSIFPVLKSYQRPSNQIKKNEMDWTCGTCGGD
jgi:hypothetical protein